MNIESAISSVLKERDSLRQPQGVSSPSYISEHMQLLTQYTSALEENLSKMEASLKKREAKLFKEYRAKGLSANASEVQTKYDVAEDNADVIRVTRLCRSSWRLISSSQSRVKHLIEEAHNQI